jgi:phage portal protein BeeE
MLLAKHDQLQFIEQYHSMTVQDIAQLYNTSETTIKDVAKKLGIFKTKPLGRWTCEPDSYYRNRKETNK